MDFFTIASGSSGNCICIGDDNSRFLIDCGISGKKIEEGLSNKGYSIADIDGILVTHEHRDHINGLGVISRRYGLPVYATKGTLSAIFDNELIGKVDKSTFHEIQNDNLFLKEFNITACHISHDAADPVAYIFSKNNKKIGIMTDLGTYDNQIICLLSGCDCILIESNHDKRMLETGIYPYHLKKRIAGNLGHLSNESSGQLISEIAHDNLKHIVLGHLSKENNFPDLALETVKLEITLSNNKYRAGDFPIEVAPRDQVGNTISI